MKMECVDCGTIVESDTASKTFEVMRQHTLGAHKREPLRTLEQYEKPTLASYYEDTLLLRPEIMLAC